MYFQVVLYAHDCSCTYIQYMYLNKQAMYKRVYIDEHSIVHVNTSHTCSMLIIILTYMYVRICLSTRVPCTVQCIYIEIFLFIKVVRNAITNPVLKLENMSPFHLCLLWQP